MGSSIFVAACEIFRCVMWDLWPGIEPRPPTLQTDSLPAEPQGKPKPISSPADLPNPGIEPGSPALQADSLPTEL